MYTHTDFLSFSVYHTYTQTRTYRDIHMLLINKNEIMNLKERKEEGIGEYWRRKWKGKMIQLHYNLKQILE